MSVASFDLAAGSLVSLEAWLGTLPPYDGMTLDEGGPSGASALLTHGAVPIARITLPTDMCSPYRDTVFRLVAERAIDRSVTIDGPGGGTRAA